jgi:hypothetical protein
MLNNVYKSQLAPQKLDKALCIPGTYCISLFKDRNFYRAQIIGCDLSSSTCRIRYIDYGNVAFVPSNSLCVIQSQFINVPPYALQCRIHNNKIHHDCHKQNVYEELKAVTGFGSTRNQNIVCRVIFLEKINSNIVYHVRLSVVQSKFNLQSQIPITNNIKYTSRVQVPLIESMTSLMT